MDTHKIFGRTIEIASKALDFRSRRHELIISNIANADTPGFKAFDLLVEKALVKDEPRKDGIQLQRTDQRHIPSSRTIDPHLRPYVTRKTASADLRGDGNTVEMEQEMANLSANQLLYKASAQIISKKFQSLRNAIQGGKR